MKFFTRIAILFYVMTISAIGALLVFTAFRIDSNFIELIDYDLQVLQSDMQLRGIVGIAGLLAILLSIMFARIISGAREKERTIAFDNPAGRVSISLYAIEDMVKKLILKESDVREARSNVVATKKGLEVEARLVLTGDLNIPAMTARMQDLIKDKIQELIGIEETIVVRIHVMKILNEEHKPKRKGNDYPDKSETTVPFQGYRA